jgi:pimeloyl-[acyl-carrier protein] methyl ester esterase
LFAGSASVHNLAGLEKKTKNPVEVVAMHGWAGDSRCWDPWIKATAPLGWQWQCGERGYGGMPPRTPAWRGSPGTLRLVIGHSLGPHLLAPEIWQSANAAVLLASFGKFVPPGRRGLRLDQALEAMSTKLDSVEEALEMLAKFMANAAHPKLPGPLLSGLADGPLNLERLRGDLQILRDSRGLPASFPSSISVLLVEGGQDQIVTPEARAMLRDAVPRAKTILLPEAGHALLESVEFPEVAGWVESLP